MLRLDAWLQRHRRAVLIAWVIALVAAAPFAAQQADHLTGGGFAAGGSQSERVERLAAESFPDDSAAALAAVLIPRPGAGPADLERAVAEVERKVARADDVAVPAGGGRAALAEARRRPGSPAIVPLDFRGGEEESIDVAVAVRAELGMSGDDPGSAAGGRVSLHLAGQGALWAAIQEVSKRDASTAEARAFPLIALVLLAAFGSLAAAVLPLSLGAAAVVASGALIYAVSRATDLSVYVTNIASMIGIGVAVDYSLFVLARYREEIGAGRDQRAARAAAMATSGIAVLFSGLTVMASLLGLFLIDSVAVRSLAVGAILVVAVAMLASSTLLPLLIALLGHRAHEPGKLARALRRRRPAEARAAGDGFWARWTGAVMRRPRRSALLAGAVLLLLAVPALDLKLGNAGLRQLDPSNETRQGAEAVAEARGPGALGPVRVLARLRDGTASEAGNERALGALTTALRRDPASAGPPAVEVAGDGRTVLLTTTLRMDPESDAARDAVDRLRDSLPAAAGGAAAVDVGGTTATILDFDELVAGSMWKIAVFVLGLSFLVLLVLLRSVILPLKAVLMNILSVAAAYGVLVAVFQWGWLEFLGLEAAPSVDTITPPLVLALAFGLSMDYEVFLLTRIRERYAATGDNRRAVAEGLATSARTITSAAVIMVVVFLAFVSTGTAPVQRLGLACAVAIAVDATLVRLVLVPALMELLGEWNWWLPRWLERLLPAADVERLPDDFGTGTGTGSGPAARAAGDPRAGMA